MKCLTQECKKFAKRRGVCFSCYSKLFKKIKKGELTWEEAEQKGLCNEKKKKQWIIPPFRMNWRHT